MAIKAHRHCKTTEELRFEKAATELGEVLKKLNKKNKLSLSFNKQLADT